MQATIIAPRNTERTFSDELSVMFSLREHQFFGTTSTTPFAPYVDITFEDSHHDKRYYLLLVATTTTGIKLGRDWLYDQGFRPGKLKKIMSTMVKKVSDDLLVEIEQGGCVDEYMRDQLVVFQALAEGQSKVYAGEKDVKLVSQSLHTQTAQWVAKEIIDVEFDEEGGCVGFGLYPGVDEANKEGEGEDLAKDLERLDISKS